jgi:hypothetical protein
LGQLAAVTELDLVLNGTSRSTSSDGAPTGTRQIADGTSIDLDNADRNAPMRKESACSDADTNAITVDRPWGISNPRWQLFSVDPWDRSRVCPMAQRGVRARMGGG